MGLLCSGHGRVRFKLDENLSRSITELFRGAGHDVTTVREQQLTGRPGRPWKG